jgi:predicted nucleotidyltransferase
MIETEAIQKLSDQIAQVFRPERIVLFGSYAYGLPTADSDVDLLVILPHRGRGSRKAAEILSQIHPPFPVDLLVRTPELIKQRLAWNDFFLREILEKGKVLYAAPDN